MLLTPQHRYTRLLYTFMFAGIFAFCSCKKEGPQGPQGSPGVQGPQGPQGPIGPAGNANVRTGTISPTSADWKWAGFWSLSTGGGSTTIYSTRYVDINTNLVTTDIVATGTVLVYFKPNNDGWVALPFRFLDVTRNYYFNFVYEYKEGRIRLHYFWDSNGVSGTTPSGLNTVTIPTYAFKYVILAGSTARQMQTARVNINDYDAVMEFLNVQ